MEIKETLGKKAGVTHEAMKGGEEEIMIPCSSGDHTLHTSKGIAM